jgi:CubicO group peptidase (beta-lactamase class C family)
MRPALTSFKLRNGSLPKWSGDSGDTDPQHGKPVAYGFGWFLDSYVDSAGKAHERMWHYGDTVGFKSAIMRFPKDGVTIIVLTNRGYDDTTAIADKFAEAVFRK